MAIQKIGWVMHLAAAIAVAQTGSMDPAGVLSQFAVSRFIGSGNVTIQAMTSDAASNVYVAATSGAPDLPTVHAAQTGESLLMLSLDRGLTWQKLTTPAPSLATIQPHPADPGTLFAGADGVYKSTDGGHTWRRVFAATTSNIFSIAVDPAPNSRFVYAYGLYPPQVLVSSDNGENWISSGGPPSPARQLWVDPSGSGRVGAGLSTSLDHGATWIQMTAPPGFQQSSIPPIETTPDPHHPDWIYALGTDAARNGVLALSKDWGASWISKPSPTPPHVSIEQLFFDPDIADSVYAAYGDLAVSSDDATTWRQIHSNPILPWIGLILDMQCSGGALIVVDGGGILSPSFDFGATWQQSSISSVQQLATGPGCALYAVRSGFATDAFVAKFAPGGKEVLWSTYLGGSSYDSASAIVVDTQGNVTVAGNTNSPDFPSTAPRIGVPGRQNGFVTKFDPNGQMLLSAVFGGELIDNVTGLAVDSQGAAYVSGYTNSVSFPVTTGSTASSPASAFAAKLAPEGSLDYATYLPGYSTDLNTGNPGVFVASEPDGSALVAYSGSLNRLTPDGSSSTLVANLPGSISNIATGPHGNVFISGEVQFGNTGSTACKAGPYIYTGATAGDVFVTKLHAKGLEPIYSSRLYGKCESRPSALVVDAKGQATLSAVTFGNFPMLNPALSVSPYDWEVPAAVVSRLSPDGQELLYSTYLDSHTPVALAVAPDGSIYAGVTGTTEALLEFEFEIDFNQQPNIGATVLQLPVAPRTPRMKIEVAANAFDPAGAVFPGTLLSITGENFTSLAVDLGLSYSGILPTQLAGVQVQFDGVVAQLIRATPDQIICVVPGQLALPNWTTVRVVSSSGQMSEPLVVPVAPTAPGLSAPGLLSQSYPAAPIGPVLGVILNADGTPNGARNPALIGSTVTALGTGLSGPAVFPIYWDVHETRPLMQGEQTLYGTATPAAGYVPGVYAIAFTVPGTPPATSPAIVVGNYGSNVVIYVQ